MFACTVDLTVNNYYFVSKKITFGHKSKQENFHPICIFTFMEKILFSQPHLKKK